MLLFVIQVLCGAAGGYGTALVFNKINLGPMGNAVAGILGGAIGGQVLMAFRAGGIAGNVSIDFWAVFGSVLAGLLGGAALVALFGGVKRLMNRPEEPRR